MPSPDSGPPPVRKKSSFPEATKIVLDRLDDVTAENERLHRELSRDLENAGALSSCDTLAASIKFQKLATAISDRIQTFGDWLGKMPGRTEVGVAADATDDDPQKLFVLRFNRKGGSWNLIFGSYDPVTAEEPANWTSLNSAPLKTKIFALTLFPALVAAFEKEHTALADKMSKVLSEYDAFAAKLGITAKEGK